MTQRQLSITKDAISGGGKKSSNRKIVQPDAARAFIESISANIPCRGYLNTEKSVHRFISRIGAIGIIALF
jgi:hypothetical protein